MALSTVYFRLTGAFFEQDDAESIEVFNTTISHQNAFNDLFRLEPIIKTIESMDGFRADQEGMKKCTLCFRSIKSH